MYETAPQVERQARRNGRPSTHSWNAWATTQQNSTNAVNHSFLRMLKIFATVAARAPMHQRLPTPRRHPAIKYSQQFGNVATLLVIHLMAFCPQSQSHTGRLQIRPVRLMGQKNCALHNTANPQNHTKKIPSKAHQEGCAVQRGGDIEAHQSDTRPDDQMVLMYATTP